MKKNSRKILLVLLVFSILLVFVGQIDFKASAFTPPQGSYIVSEKESNIVPGVVENEIVYNTLDEKNPVSSYMIDINLDENVKIMVASKDYNKRGTQTVREMATAAEAATGRNIVVAINADLNWSGTGISSGPVIIDGQMHNDVPAQFFGITYAGEPVIGDGNKFVEMKDDLYQAVKGMGWLVKDSKVIVSGESLAPRTAVGIKADGTVFFYIVEGRMFPRSVGLTISQLAQIMLDYGAVMALNMDGGGSTTYLAKLEGETNLELRSIPSDGSERESLNALLVYAEKGDGVFDHAAITTAHDLYTPNTEVQFIARGVDSIGGPATIPSGLTWKLVDDKYGTISSSGKFKSNSNEGIVEVYLEDSDGNKVGEGSVEIRTPDSMTFVGDKFSLGFNDSNDFGLRLTYKQRVVKSKDGDIVWEYDSALGKVQNNIFISNPSQTINGTIKATVLGTNITKELYLEIGKLPIVLFDFEDDASNANWRTSYARLTKNPSVSFVHRDSGEPVRFGDKAMKIDFDFTSYTGFPAGAYASFSIPPAELGGTYTLPGTPTGIGMWIYLPEEVRGQGLWFRGGVKGQSDTGQFSVVDYTGSNADWDGWQYVEASLVGQTPPFEVLPSQFIRIMVTGGLKDEFGNHVLPVGSVYVDNITITYGTNPEDNIPPVVHSIKANGNEFEDGKVFNSNSFIFEASYHDVEDENSTGIDTDNVNIYIDGVNYNNKDGYLLDITQGKVYLQNVYLTDGIHELKLIVVDNSGNETVQRRFFEVKSGKDNKVYLEEESGVVIGKDYVLALKADEIHNIESVDLSFRISNYLADYEVEFSDAFEGSVEYIRGVQILNIKATRKNNFLVDEILKIKFPISSSLTENVRISYNLNIGEFEYIVDGTEGRFLKSFSLLPQNIQVAAPLKLTSNIILIGKDAIFNIVDINDRAVSAVEIFKVDSSGNKVSLGSTDENGQLILPEFSKTVEGFTIVAQKGEDISFEFKTQSFASFGEVAGTPYNIVAHGVDNPAESKNITWLSNSFATNQAVVLEYALKADYENLGAAAFESEQGQSIMYAFSRSQNINSNYVVNINSVIIEGLVSGSEYVYRVGNGDVFSEVRSFRTSLKDSAVDFLVLGDFQTSNYTDLVKNLNKIALDGKEYDFGIQIGDFVDDAGMFGNWNGTLSSVSNSVIGDLDIIHVLGNHEYYGDELGESSQAIFNLPDSPNKNSYYSVEYGMVYIGVIHYTPYEDELIEALEWLVEDASKSTATWRILATHQSPYYTNPQGGNQLFNKLVPSYAEAAEIDFVFSGHDHAYARTKPLVGGEVNEDGVVYIVTGAVGEKRYDVEDNPDFHFELTSDQFESIYLSITANETTFSIVVHDVGDKSILDSYMKEIEIIEGPLAEDVKIVGDFLSGGLLEVEYTYSNTNEDPEAGTKFAWYVDGELVGEEKTIELLPEWAGKTIEVRVTAASAVETGLEVIAISSEVVLLFGDVNNDGVVDNADAELLLAIIVGKEELTEDQKMLARIAGEIPTLKEVRAVLRAGGAE